MESANSHHHHQDQLVGSSAPSSSYALGFTSSFLSGNNTSSGLSSPSYPPNESCSMFNTTLRPLQQQQQLAQQDYTTTTLLSSISPPPPPPPYLGFGFTNHQDSQQSSRLNINKQQLSVDQYYRRYTDLLSIDDNTNKQLMIPTNNFAHTINHHHDMINLDALASSRFNAHFDHMHQQPLPFYAPSSNKVSTAVEQAKRNSNKMEPKALLQNAPKKSRLEARSSCPPFKVRKEKLGDRIAALQQLVAPFGKTDTASVLMEAIGYIKFLQTQVETLSVPYMKAASGKKASGVTKRGVGEKEEKEEGKRWDLKRRGLCLVPLSCLSYITTDAAVWPPPHFGAPT